MSENAERTISRQLTLLPEASLASLTVLPGSVEAQQMTVTSGQSISAYWKDSDLGGCLAKMFLVSLPPCSTRCYLTWKVKVTPARRLLFRLWPSMPRTGGSGYSLWPTPRAVMPDNLGSNPIINERGRIVRASGEDFALNLRDAVRLWPTPRANSAMAATITAEADANRHPNLETVLKKREPSVVGGQLNPTFVEWLMGFPKDWTVVPG